MPGKAAKIQCTEKQLAIVKKLAATTKTPRRIAQRTHITLMGYEKNSIETLPHKSDCIPIKLACGVGGGTNRSRRSSRSNAENRPPL